MTAKEYRLKAYEIVKPNQNKLALVVFLYCLIEGVLSATGVGAIVYLVIYGPLTLGLVKIIVKNAKGEEFNNSMLFDGFKTFTNSLCVGLLQTLYLFLWSLLLLIPSIIKSLSYSMTFFIHNDHPEYSAKECIKKSKEIMHGHKWELFCLMFSYIGWYLLCSLTLGILLFWIAPRVYTAKYLFYKDINGEPEKIETVEE